MLHIVITGNIQTRSIFEKLEPIFFKLEVGIIKSSEMFISQSKTSMIIKTLVIEKENKIFFLIQVNDRDDGVVVRLYPDYEIPKTFGVKKSLAEIAKLIRKGNDELNIGKTNLTKYL
ncbi:MAG: hypothetical protein ACXACK_03210 [Candidatus Hodarchaeales archaeon]|jgi:hypothetical protein